LRPENEFFRLTINQDPVGDTEWLGDRSLVGFINSPEGIISELYFAVYNYDQCGATDDTNVYYKVDATGLLTNWFYTFTAYSVKKRAAMVYLRFGDVEINK